MKIQIASDLHLNPLEGRFPGYRVVEPAEADVLVLAGDIHRATRVFDVFDDWPVPVIYVHGNHDLYNAEYAEAVEKMRTASAGSNVHFLEGDDCVLDGVRFLGCCLWTDYALYPGQERAAMAEAEPKMRDHSAIRTAQGHFAPDDALRIHQQSRAWLQAQLAQPFNGPTVVVTHHAPHPHSVHARYAGMLLNAAFVSDLTPLFGAAKLWIHGHVHDSFDYEVAGTRVVANPRGYALNRAAAASPDEIVWENKDFDARLVVEV
ncbi:metallophosphoesterase [Noviherbaspirillum agri]